MLYLTTKEANRVIEWVNGFPMTYADYLDNTNCEFVVLEDK